MKIQSGTAKAGHNDPDWELHKGHGPRTHRFVVKFPEPFSVPPTVTASLAGFEAQSKELENFRLEVRVVKAEHDKFKLEYKTSGYMKVMNITVTWLAHGA
ncbi:MAG: H-type lectin domain-containing protein [Sandaracinaceae bacterium]|nr:MAG: hypothetical protein EVA89_10360 [Sandaracinaceae bacterium]HBQ09947.1 hypothetical protein [Myxococcales bacterium]